MKLQPTDMPLFATKAPGLKYAIVSPDHGERVKLFRELTESLDDVYLKPPLMVRFENGSEIRFCTRFDLVQTLGGLEIFAYWMTYEDEKDEGFLKSKLRSRTLGI